MNEMDPIMTEARLRTGTQLTVTGGGSNEKQKTKKGRVDIEIVDADRIMTTEINAGFETPGGINKKFEIDLSPKVNVKFENKEELTTGKPSFVAVEANYDLEVRGGIGDYNDTIRPTMVYYILI